MIYVDDYGIEKDKVYIIQLLIIMGKFHIHKMKWSGGKTNCFYFINEFKQYCNTIYKCRQVNCTIFIICFNYYVWQWQQVCDQIGAFTTSIRAPNITTRWYFKLLVQPNLRWFELAASSFRIVLPLVSTVT